MKYKFFFIVFVSFIIGFTFLYFEGAKIKYLQVFLPHKEKPQTNIQNKTPQNPQLPKIIYGVNVDMSQLLPNSTHYVVNSRGQDLIDIAKSLGINLFRITSVTPGFGTKGYIYTKLEWNRVLNKMSENGIKALILIESPNLNPNDYSQNYLNLVKSYILDSGVLENEDVFAVDIRNEPVLNTQNLNAMAKVSRMIKDVSPNIKITVGGWRTLNPNARNESDQYIWMDGQDGKKLSSIVDFYSIHTYEFDKKFLGVYPDSYNLTEYSLNKVLPMLSDKPILIEEFGAGNGDAITDQQTLGSKELQANVYDGVYQSVIDMHTQNVMGSVAYVFLKRNVKVEGFAIAKDNGNTLFPAAYVLQKYALGNSDIPLNIPFTNVPNDLLLINSDNNKTINVKVNDIIGLRLNLSSDYTNSALVSTPSVLLKSEPLTRENNQEFVDSVYHAVKKGKTTIKIVGRNSKGTVTRFSVNVIVSE